MSDSEQVLIPIREQSVGFYGDEISVALIKVGDQEQVYVSLRPICDYLVITGLVNTYVLSVEHLASVRIELRGN